MRNNYLTDSRLDLVGRLPGVHGHPALRLGRAISR